MIRENIIGLLLVTLGLMTLVSGQFKCTAEVSNLEINAESSYEITYKRVNLDLAATTLRIAFNKENFLETPNSVFCTEISGFSEGIGCNVEDTGSQFYIEITGFSDTARRFRFQIDSIQNSFSQILNSEIGSCQLFNSEENMVEEQALKLAHSQFYEATNLGDILITQNTTANGAPVKLDFEIEMTSQLGANAQVNLTFPKLTQNYVGRGIQEAYGSAIITECDLQAVYDTIAEILDEFGMSGAITNLQSSNSREVFPENKFELYQMFMETKKGAGNKFTDKIQQQLSGDLISSVRQMPRYEEVLQRTLQQSGCSDVLTFSVDHPDYEDNRVEGRVVRGAFTDSLIIQLENEDILSGDDTLTIITTSEHSAFVNPVSPQPYFFLIITTDINGNPVDYNQPGLTLSTTEPSPFVPYGYAEVVENSNQGESGAVYEFGLLSSNPVPSSGYLAVTIPSTVGISAQTQVLCVAGCAYTDDTEVIFDDVLNTFLLTNVFQSEFLSFVSPLTIQVTGLTSPSNYNSNLFTIATYDNLHSDFAIDSESIGVAPKGLLTFDRVKNRQRRKFIVEFTCDREFPADAIYIVTFEGELLLDSGEQECDLKAKPNGDWACDLDLDHNRFIVYQTGEDAAPITVGEEVSLTLGRFEDARGAGSVTVDILTNSYNQKMFFFEHVAGATVQIE